MPENLLFICTAYQLLSQYGRNVDVGDWFASFCLALGAPRAGGTEELDRRGKKGRRAPKRKRKMKTVERSVQGAPAEDAAGEGAPAEDQQEVCIHIVCPLAPGLSL